MPVNVGGITGAFGMLMQANAQAAAVRRQERERRRQQRAGGLSNLGAIVGGVAGGIYGGPQGAALGAGAGSTLGRAVGGGGPVQAGEAIQIGAGIAGMQQQMAQQQQMEQMGKAEQGILQNLQPTPQQMALEPGMSGPADVAAQGDAAGLAGLIQASKQAPPGSRLSMLGAALQARQALQPSVPKPVTLAEGADLVDPTTGRVVATNDKPQSPSNPFGGGERGMAMAHILRFNQMRRNGIPLTPQEQEQDALARQVAAKTSQFTDKNGNVWEMPGITPPDIYKPGEGEQPTTTQVPDIPKPRKIMEGPEKDVPQAVRENLQAYDASLRNLDVIEQNVEKAGPIKGWISRAGAFVGVDKGAIEFQQAQNQMKLDLQSTIKGIPSDKDQKLIDNLIVDLNDPQAVVRTKVRMMREAINRKARGELDYLREQNYAVDELQKAWESEGVPVGTEQNPAVPDSVKAFEGLPSGAWFINPADGRLLQKR